MKIAFVCPCNGISGGLLVVYRQAHALSESGHNVHIIFSDDVFGKTVKCYPNFQLPTSYLTEVLESNEFFDVVISTWWRTFYEMFAVKARRFLYFVQSDERRFFPEQSRFIPWVEASYRAKGVGYITEARWIQKRLLEEFGTSSEYAPNGIDNSLFNAQGRDRRNEPLTLLIEGPIDQSFKRMPQTYRVADRLRKAFPGTRIILVTSQRTAEMDDWQIDEIHEKVPFEQMAQIYRTSDILLKLSSVEGFVGPPLEAMACGCVSVVTRATGFDEYLVNEMNSLLVDIDDFEGAYQAGLRLMKSSDLREKLRSAGLVTAQNMDWRTRTSRFESALHLLVSKSTDSVGREDCFNLALSHLAVLDKYGLGWERRTPGDIQIFRKTAPLKVYVLFQTIHRAREWHAQFDAELRDMDTVIWCHFEKTQLALLEEEIRFLPGTFENRFIALNDKFLKFVSADMFADRLKDVRALVSIVCDEAVLPTGYLKWGRDLFDLHPTSSVAVPFFMDERGNLRPKESDLRLGSLFRRNTVPPYSIFRPSTLKDEDFIEFGVSRHSAFWDLWMTLKVRGGLFSRYLVNGRGATVDESRGIDSLLVQSKLILRGDFLKLFFLAIRRKFFELFNS